MRDLLIMILCGSGTLFILLAAIGMLRMPDFYTRTSVTTKAVTLGLGLILAGAAVYFSQIDVTSRVLAIILFLILTAPVGAHMIGRAAYRTGSKMWEKSVMDDMKDVYQDNQSKEK
ncbi:MAG: monovalent cation/H(+) antiporter subunit G [Flavobacteriales bacterium]